MNDHGQWQLRGGAPELYERYLVPAITALWATDLIERAAPRPGERVLDLACGTGIVARLAEARMGAGRIVGIDINSGMLAVARSHPAERLRRSNGRGEARLLCLFRMRLSTRSCASSGSSSFQTGRRR